MEDKLQQLSQKKEKLDSDAFEPKELMTEVNKSRLLKIGELARETGELVTTLRFWTKEGLLVVREYSPGGYQLYEPSMIERAKEIRRLQNDKRLSIAEIKVKIA